MSYCNATICRNGHIISRVSSNHQNFCTKCGKETYSFCPNCGNPIRGFYKIENLCLSRTYEKPFYCHDCGFPYPWTQNLLDSAVELLSSSDELDEISKDLIKSAIPELLVESPATPIAINKYQKGIRRAGQATINSLRQLLIDVVSESVKKYLFS